MAGLGSLRAVNRRNLNTLWKTPAAEISGALGDLGTFLPLTLALARHSSIDLASTLVTSGLFNIITGVVFGVPLPVQPMKAIAAAALADSHAPRDSAIMAGFLVGAALLLLSATGLLRLLTAHTPLSVIKGIQLGTGLSLILSSTPLLTSPSHIPYLPSPLLAFLALPPLLLSLRSPRFPSALLLIFFGILLALPHHLPSFKHWNPHLHIPFTTTYAPALSMALAQLPLTTLNSILAVTSLSSSLLPEVSPPSTTALGLSVAAMNLSCTFLRSMPVCHGAGGLAAQFRFGARSGASVIILGTTKVVIGLLFGDSLRGLLEAFPSAVLGVLLVVAGAELGRCGMLGEGEEGMTVVLMTAAGMLALKNAAGGFAVGMLWYWAYRGADWWEGRSGETDGDGERRALLG